jgi:two-component system cell cycle sensor histidine kinase/response regulator CckA
MRDSLIRESAALGQPHAVVARIRRKELLADLGLSALEGAPLRYVFEQAAQLVRAGLCADMAGLVEHHPDGSFVLRGGDGLPPESTEWTLPGDRGSQAGYTASSGEVVVVQDVQAESRFSVSDELSALGVRAGMTVPVGRRDSVWGVVGVFWREPREFSDADVAFLRLVASTVSAAIANDRAREELAEAKRFFHAVVENAPDIIVRFDRELRHLYVSPAVTATTGLPPEHFLGRTNREIGFPEALCAQWDTQLTAVFESGEPQLLEFEHEYEAGAGARLLEARAVPERNANGEVTTVVSFTRDRTDAQRAELEKRASEVRYRELFERAMDMIFLMDTEGVIVDANPAAEIALGYGRGELIGHSSDLVVAPGERARARERLASKRDGSEPSSVYESELVTSAGVRFAVEASSQVIIRDGQPAGVLAITRDISAQRAARAALADSERRFRSAFDGAAVGMMLVNTDTTLIRANSTLAGMLGYSSDELAGMSILDIMHPDDAASGAAQIEKLTAGASDRFVAEKRYRTKDGATVWGHVGVSPVRSDDGSVSYFVAQIEDVTELRRVQEELEASEVQLRHAQKMEAVGRLAGGIAHDFNNLLLAIRGYGELALKGMASGEDTASADVEEMLGAAHKAAELTKQLLALSRKQVMNPEVLDLGAVVEELAKLLRRLIGEDIELLTSAPDAPLFVRADRVQIEQVIANLAVNARDAMPDGGRLSIEVTRSDAPQELRPSAVLVVRDRGAGMDAETLSRIFEPFFTTKGEEGTGLGLATVHGIVTQSGGRIGVESEPGRGTTFTIVLPLTEDVPAAATVAAALPEHGAETILLVEDDPSVRSSVGRLLESSGYRVLSAESGEEALTLAREPSLIVDVLVTDLVMKGLNGRETADRVRELQPCARVLYMSGYTDDAVIRVGALGPGAAFIQKPFHGAEIAQRIRSLLESPR